LGFWYKNIPSGNPAQKPDWGRQLFLTRNLVRIIYLGRFVARLPDFVW
jgi:hypothetical protein